MQRSNNSDRRPGENPRPANRPPVAEPRASRPAPRPVNSAPRPSSGYSRPAPRPGSAPARPSGGQGRPGYHPSAANHRQAVSRRRRRRVNRRRLFVAAAALMLLVVIVILVVSLTGGRKDAQLAAAPTSTPAPSVEATVAPTPSPVPTPSPTPEPSYYANAQYRPSAKDGWLPVFRKAATDEKMICITVDDCFQAENLRTIVQTALDNNAKLTIFPIGDEAIREKQSQILKWAWENGMEIENHTYTHSGLYNVSDERLANEIYKQNLAISGILGVEYQGHFLRPRGGDARNDQRIHAYINQLGYYGIAHWSASGSGSSMKSLPGKLEPGAIYLFHTTNDDLEKLVRFIPYAVSQGYRLVTMNEMFGYPENETAPLKHVSEYPVPTLAPYEEVPVTLKANSYCYAAYKIQEKLIALGYLDGEPDGVYGKGCAAAVAKFQKANGLEATGEADPQTQQKLDELYRSKTPM